MAFEQELILAGRILLGGVAAVFGLNHFMKTDEMSGWAEAKGVPAARAAVLFTGGLLLLAGLGVMAYAAPVLSTGALVVFVLAASFWMHDFWNMEGEDRQNNIINFMKNLAIVGGLLLFASLAASGTEVEYAVGLEIL